MMRGAAPGDASAFDLRLFLKAQWVATLGLLPMVFQINVNYATGSIGIGSTTSDWWVLLASAVVYGLFFSTLLTLVLTPALLAAPATLRRRFSRMAGGAGAIDLGPFGALQARHRTRDAAE